MALDDYHNGPKRQKNYSRISEDTLHQQAIEYIRLRHRDVLLRTDYAAGLGLTKVQARKHARMQGNTKDWPDVQVAQPMGHYHGFFVELKAPDVELFMKRDGSVIRQDDYKVRLKGDWANKHYEDQAIMLARLRELGYWAEFAVGFDEFQQMLDNYLRGQKMIVRYELGKELTERDPGTFPNMTPF